MHVGWRPLVTATALACLLHFLVSTCYLPSYTHAGTCRMGLRQAQQGLWGLGVCE